jgi:hypothetical protein
MIRFRDTVTLAVTKLRTRKVRLTITIIISGLLFAGLVGASMVARGAFHSINTFSKEGLGERYIVKGLDVSSQAMPNFYSDPGVIDRAIAIQKDIVKRKTAEAKRLDIPYDAATEPPAFEEYSIPGGSKQRSVAFGTDAGKQAVKEYLAEHPSPGAELFEKNAAGYQPKATYRSLAFPFSTEGRLQVLKDGVETYDQNSQKAGPSKGLDSFPTTWAAMSKDLLKPFALDGQGLGVGSDGSMPIIVPYSAAEQLLGLQQLPATTGSSQKLARTKQVREKAKDITFTLCYRNSTSAGLIDSAISSAQEIERNKQNKDYKKPDLIYGLPERPCGPATITRDVRTAEQKKMEAKQEQFAQTFGKPTASETTVAFRVAGIVPDPPAQNAAGVDQIISSLVASSLGSGWYSPIEEVMQQPLLAGFFNDPLARIMGEPPSYYAELPSAAQARAFIDQQTCTLDFSVFDKAPVDGEIPNPAKACLAEDKYFELSPFGSNSLALESASKQFGTFFMLAALVVAAIGAIIMMGTVGRMIADSRRETAVFRAIGAKRLDIAQIYLLYTALLSIMISAFAVLGGLVAAMVTQRYFAEEITVQALVAYNARDLNQTFSLFGFYWPDLLFLTAIAIGIGLVSVAIPLIRNVRRNPIRDMRDDT